MHRKQVVSLFIIIITIVTINCVINAIQQLCKHAVSDAVSYLQYEEKNDGFNSFLVMDLVFPGILSLLNHHRPVYTATGFTVVCKLVMSDLQLHISSQKPHIVRKLPFSETKRRIG